MPADSMMTRDQLFHGKAAVIARCPLPRWVFELPPILRQIRSKWYQSAIENSAHRDYNEIL